MDAKTITLSNTAIGLKTDNTETRTDNGNWRLKQAIDLVLDYIMQLEEKSLGDANFSGEANALSF